MTVTRPVKPRNYVPPGGFRLWPFVFRRDLPPNIPRHRPHLHMLEGILRARFGLELAKPNASRVWLNMPRERVASLMCTGGAGVEHPSRTLVAGLIRPGESVLDAGCGTGVNYDVLHAQGKAGGYVGVDLTEQAIDIARQTHPGADFRVGDVQALTQLFAPQSLDVVMLRHVLEHLPDFETAMQQAIDVSRRLAVFTFYLPPRRLPLGIRSLDPRPGLGWHVRIYSRPAIERFLAGQKLHWRWHDGVGRSRAGWLASETNSVLVVSRRPDEIDGGHDDRA